MCRAHCRVQAQLTSWHSYVRKPAFKSSISPCVSTWIRPDIQRRNTFEFVYGHDHWVISVVMIANWVAVGDFPYRGKLSWTSYWTIVVTEQFITGLARWTQTLLQMNANGFRLMVWNFSLVVSGINGEMSYWECTQNSSIFRTYPECNWLSAYFYTLLLSSILFY